MDISFIIMIIIGAIILFYATKFLSATLKIVTKIILIVIVLFVILTVIIYNDLMSLKNGVLTITKLKLMGEKAACTLSGDITLNPADIKSSQINLNAAIELPGQNNKKISMVLTGPLGNPTIKYT